MLTFFSFVIDTKDQQFQTDEEVRAFIKEFIDTSVSTTTSTVVNYIQSLMSHDNILLNSTRLLPADSVTGKRNVISTKTFVSTRKAAEFENWYVSTGKALINEMYSGLGWEVGDGLLHFVSDEDWQKIKDGPMSDLARQRIQAYDLANA